MRRADGRCVDNANREVFNAANVATRSTPAWARRWWWRCFAATRLLLGHIGDSRGYRFRDGHLEQLTRDHSLLQEQIDAGLITAEQAAYSTHKNLVTRAVGVEELVTLEIHDYPVEPGDLLLMCSDGLSDMLDDEQIEQLLQGHDTLAEAARALVAGGQRGRRQG